MITRQSRNDIDVIAVAYDASRMLDEMAGESAVLHGEIGGVMCHDKSGNTAVVHDVVPIREGSLNENHFKITADSIKSASRFHCSNESPILVHTHPSGDHELSHGDREFSKRYNIIVCALAGKSLRCSDGDREIETRLIKA